LVGAALLQWAAAQAISSARTSPALCPASERSASEFAARPYQTSAATKKTLRTTPIANGAWLAVLP